MEFKNLVKENKLLIIFYAILFAIFVALASLFPYSGDDWAWGSEIGLERLETFFEGYNGRYSGNLLVLVLTRLPVLNTIITAASMLLCCIIPVIYARTKKPTAVLISALVFLIVPIEIFRQAIAWTSGFSNYVPPILIALIYFSVINNVFKDECPTYTVGSSIYLSAIFLVLSFVGSLFMENVTIFYVVISLTIIVYTLVRWKKVYPVHISYFAGSVIGTVVMFSNSVYHSISEGEDGYRDVAKGEEFWEMIAENTSVICKGVFVNALPLIIFVSVLCVVSVLRYQKTAESRLMKNLSLVCAGVNICSLFVFVAHKQFAGWQMVWGDEEESAWALAAIVVLYCFSVLFTVIITVPDIGAKARLILPLFSVVLLLVPLLVVNPIGPRCYFPPYMALAVFCICYLQHLLPEEGDKPFEYTKLISVCLICACLGSLLFLGNTYKTIDEYTKKRDYYIQRQIELGYETVTVCYMPFTVNVHMPNPVNDSWPKRYKLFHGIDPDIKFTYLATEKFDEWAEKFDEKHPK